MEKNMKMDVYIHICDIYLYIYKTLNHFAVQ